MSIFFLSVFMMVVPVSRQANRPTLNTLWGVRHELVSIRPTEVTYCSDTTEEFSGASGLSGYLARISIFVPLPAVLPEPVTWRIRRRLGLLRRGFK